MNIGKRPKLVLLGMMTKMPVAGVVWQTIHYLVGFQRLGFDVYYSEAHGMNPSMFTDTDEDNGAAKAAAFIARAMARFDLGSRWSYHAWADGDRYYGIGESEMHRLYRDAAAVINLHGGTMPRPEHTAGKNFIYLSTDPVALEIELHDGLKATEDFLDQHTAFFSFGENIGAPDCGLPVPPARYQFHATRQPVIVDFWQPQRTGAGERFTTIGNWQQPWRQVTFNGETYHWSKHYEFLKFLDLPSRTKQEFELGLSRYEPADREMLERHGWHVRRALDFSVDLDDYRQYIAESRGEWTVAKDQNVRLRSGWFSDRSASYLAAGRPVITQETGFDNVLPSGEGLFGFLTMEETLAAVDAINSDYARHSAAAAEIAREYFNYDVVLPKLLEQAGVALPNYALVRPPVGRTLHARNGSAAKRPLAVADIAPQIPFVDGVNVIGYLSTESGVGEASRGYVRALQTLETPLALHDVSDLCGNRAQDRSLALPATDAAYEVNLVCVDIDKHFSVLARLGEEFFDGRYNIGVWAWETQDFPKKWFDRFAYYDEIWVGTSFIADHLAPISPVPVLRVPPVLAAPAAGDRQVGREQLGVAEDEFVFLFIFDGNSTFRRKNPLAIAEAFRRAFSPEEKVRLVFKCVNAERYPADFAALQRRADGYPIEIHEGYWTADEMRNLMAACDAYVSFHRSEGTGLTISHAMAEGKPVIATGWSGNMDFMTPANSFPVRYELMNIEPDSSGPYKAASGSWADVSLAHAAEMMRFVRDHPAEAAARAARGQADIAQNFSAERVAALIQQRLRAIAIRRRFAEFQGLMKQRFSGYVQTIRQIRQTVAAKIPARARVAVASRGDEQLVHFAEHDGWHFPQTEDGVYAGDHPADGAAAVSQIERLRGRGAGYLVIPNTMFWWFESYPDFKTHLEKRYGTLWRDESCAIYNLHVARSTPRLAAAPSESLEALRGSVRALRERQAISKNRVLELVQNLRHATEQKQAALRDLEAKLQAARPQPPPALPAPPPSAPAIAPEQRKRQEYVRLLDHIRADLDRLLPFDATLAVVTKGDANLLHFGGRRAWHFPRTAEGKWGGHHPRDSHEAITQLEEFRRQGVQYLLIPAPYFWWLDHYGDLAKHLAAEYKAILRDEFCAVFDIRDAASQEPEREARRDEEEHRRTIPVIRAEVRDAIPQEATVIVATQGDSELLNLDGRRAWHFPRDEQGNYHGPPTNGPDLIAQLEQLRAGGGQYFIFPSRTFWWANAFPEFKGHLDSEYQLLRSREACIIYSVVESASEARQAEARAKRASYGSLVQRLRDFVSENLPLDAALAVVSKGDAELLNLEGRRAWHFPRTEEGQYAGKHPADDGAAISHLEALRGQGVQYFVLPAPYFWWLTFYPEFQKHLEAEYQLLYRTDDFLIYEVREAASASREREQFHENIRAAIPPDASVAVATQGDSQWLKLGARRAWHFPREADGSYRAGEPTGAAELIAHLEELRRLSVQFLVLPHAAFSWLEKFPEFQHHLSAEYQLARTDSACLIYAVAQSASETREAEARAKRAAYEALVQRVRRLADATLPQETTVAISSKGDPALLDLGGRDVWHFPRTETGEYAGRHPADDAAIIAHLEELREKGADYFVLIAPYFWWLTFYPGFKQQLDAEYRLVEDTDDARIYHIRDSATAEKRQAQLRATALEFIPEGARLAVLAGSPWKPLELENRTLLTWTKPGSGERQMMEECLGFLDHARAATHLLITRNLGIQAEYESVVRAQVERRFELLHEDEACQIYRAKSWWQRLLRPARRTASLP